MRQATNAPSQMVTGEGGSTPVPALPTGLGSADFNLPFFHVFHVLKSTTQASPYTYNLTLPIGIIRRLTIEFPKGCAGLVGIQVYRGVTQVFPLPAGVWLKSDNSVLKFEFTHEMFTEPMFLELRAYNEDDTYFHEPWIGFEMSGQTRDIPPQLVGLLNYLKG